MNYLKIENNGELDIRLFSLMGGTTKDNDSAKIGQWGSGLKYAICFLLREQIPFKFFSGETEVKITTTKEIINNEEFSIIYVDGEKTSLSTKMGGDAWKEWQCLREIYSNALDEGGTSIKTVKNLIKGKAGKTTFLIYATPNILEIYNNWGDYFIENKVPMYENERFKLYPTGGNLKLYKQGVLIGTKEVQSIFSYDFKYASINELREYRGSFESDLAEIIYSIDDVETIKYIIENINDDCFESRIDYKFWRDSSWQRPNKAWEQAFGNAKIITQKIKDKIEAKQANVDLTHTIVVPEKLYKGLNHHIENISALRLADKVNEFYEIIDEELELKLKSAIVILEECEYFMHPELNYLFGEFGTGTTLARVDLDKKEVLLSCRLKESSMFEFCATLIEENEHMRTGYVDESRAFQQHWINLFVDKLFKMNNVKL